MGSRGSESCLSSSLPLSAAPHRDTAPTLPAEREGREGGKGGRGGG